MLLIIVSFIYQFKQAKNYKIYFLFTFLISFPIKGSSLILNDVIPI